LGTRDNGVNEVAPLRTPAIFACPSPSASLFAESSSPHDTAFPRCCWPLAGASVVAWLPSRGPRLSKQLPHRRVARLACAFHRRSELYFPRVWNTHLSRIVGAVVLFIRARRVIHVVLTLASSGAAVSFFLRALPGDHPVCRHSHFERRTGCPGSPAAQARSPGVSQFKYLVRFDVSRDAFPFFSRLRAQPP
jgi:hypothetical protein